MDIEEQRKHLMETKKRVGLPMMTPAEQLQHLCKNTKRVAQPETQYESFRATRFDSIQTRVRKIVYRTNKERIEQDNTVVNTSLPIYDLPDQKLADKLSFQRRIETIHTSLTAIHEDVCEFDFPSFVPLVMLKTSANSQFLLNSFDMNVLVHIFGFCKFSTIMRLSRVNKFWNRCTKAVKLWHNEWYRLQALVADIQKTIIVNYGRFGGRPNVIKLPESTTKILQHFSADEIPSNYKCLIKDLYWICQKSFDTATVKEVVKPSDSVKEFCLV